LCRRILVAECLLHGARSAVARGERSKAGKVDSAAVELEALHHESIERPLERADIDPGPERHDRPSVAVVERAPVAIDD
jgi:hypothetical protein